MIDWRLHTVNTLAKLGVRKSKSMGQNFLIRYRIVNDIISKSNISTNDAILEIGGGLGILTKALVATGAKITVIEKEKKLADYLSTTFPQIEVIHGDALDVPWPKNCRVISNLPYSISTPIIEKILHHSSPNATIMLQKEVANRCLSKPGRRDFSRLSALCNIHATSTKLFDVPPSAFYPQPKVDSAVIQLHTRPPQLANDHQDLELLIRNLFSLRRRKVRSVVRGFLKRQQHLLGIWDEMPNKEKRIFEFSVNELDELLTFLKSREAWPLTNRINP